MLEDYRDGDNKEEIFQEFLKIIWASPNKRVTYTRYSNFDVLPELIKTDVGKVFENYKSIPYIVYKSRTDSKTYIDLIRQKINNLYSTMCDSNICVPNEYMNMIKFPKTLYYKWQSNLDKYTAEEVSILLEENAANSIDFKKYHAKTKLKITWSEYKILIALFLRRIFDNYIPFDEFENNNKMILDIDLITEDNYIISYFCKSLNGYMKNYQKEYYGIKRGNNLNLQRCECGGLFIQNTNKTRRRCNLCNKYQPIEHKLKICVDCGKEFIIDGIVKNKKRCESCQQIRNTNLNNERVKKFRQSKL